MKKSLIALVAIIALATTSFASVSFLVAPGIGEGKIGVLGMYATNHNGNLANQEEPQLSDVTSLGLRVSYGIMANLDVLAAYSADTMVNVKDMEAKQEGGSTTGIGVKYTLSPDWLMGLPVDAAVLLGYETSAASVKFDAEVGGGKASVGLNTIALAAIFSKKMDNLIPYGGIALKSLTRTGSGSGAGARKKMDDLGGTALAFNLGCMIGVAENTVVAIEYNTENQSFGEPTKSGKKLDDAFANSVSGISLGVAYVF